MKRILSVGLLCILMVPGAQAAEARIGDFKFECRTQDGKRLKPKHGDIDGAYFIDLPGQRDACLATVDRKIAWCHENTVFTSNTENREQAGCLPIFEAQAQQCVAFFRHERHKCDAGGAGSASLRTGAAAPDPWSDDGSSGGGSEWDPPAPEASSPGGRKQTAARPSPAAGDADEDASSYTAALSEVLGEAPQGEAAQDDYTGALAALEERAAEARREEERREEEARELREAERTVLSSSSTSSGGSGCAAAMRRAKELEAKTIAVLKKLERSPFNEELRAAHEANVREINALIAANPGC